MEKPDCICLPLMHALGPGDAGLRALHLWPGLPDISPRHWQPEDFPFSPGQAEGMLAEMASMRMPDMAAWLNSAQNCNFSNEIKRQDELAHLARFAGRSIIRDAFAAVREQAHKILLWRWLLEESALEINRLERACEKAEAALPRFFGENPPDPSPASAAGEAMALDESALGKWQVFVVNALLFIPGELPLLVQGGMLADIIEIEGLRPDDWMPQNDDHGGLFRVSAPLWRILDGKKPLASQMPELNALYNQERIWLARL